MLYMMPLTSLKRSANSLRRSSAFTLSFFLKKREKIFTFISSFQIKVFGDTICGVIRRVVRTFTLRAALSKRDYLVALT